MKWSVHLDQCSGEDIVLHSHYGKGISVRREERNHECLESVVYGHAIFTHFQTFNLLLFMAQGVLVQHTRVVVNNKPKHGTAELPTA